MTNTPAEFIQWCLDHPTDNLNPGASWDQKCASLVFRAGGFASSRASAYKVAIATRDEFKHHLARADELPFARIPLGWMVYFDKGGEANGHVGMSLGDGRMLNANWRVTPMTPSHKALGYYGIAQYAGLTGCTYLGASPYWLNQTLDLTNLAGVDMPLDASDKAFLNTLGAAIVEQIKGNGAYAADADTINGVKRDIGFIHTESPTSLKAIFAKTGGGSSQEVLAAIAALDQQADTYQAQLLAAIANVDEATLATFGLKRI